MNPHATEGGSRSARCPLLGSVARSVSSGTRRGEGCRRPADEMPSTRMAGSRGCRDRALCRRADPVMRHRGPGNTRHVRRWCISIRGRPGAALAAFRKARDRPERPRRPDRWAHGLFPGRTREWDDAPTWSILRGDGAARLVRCADHVRETVGRGMVRIASTSLAIWRGMKAAVSGRPYVGLRPHRGPPNA